MIVFVHPGGTDYVGVDEDGDWWQWPAEAHGWARKRTCDADLHEHCQELPSDLAWFAVKASGVAP